MAGNLGEAGCASVLLWRKRKEVLGFCCMDLQNHSMCLPISLLPSWEPSLILSSGSGVISVAELGELWLEAIAKQGLEKPPANTVPLGEVGIFLAYMIFFYRSNK